MITYFYVIYKIINATESIMFWVSVYYSAIVSDTVMYIRNKDD